jgi:hypothetical protein
MPNKNFPFKIGADPEFNIAFANKKVNAKYLISSLFNMSESDGDGMGVKIKEKNKSFGTLGWDGCHSTGEIRPDPSANPYTVVENLRKMFEVLASKCQTFNLSTLSNLSSVGGHIHLELKKPGESTVSMEKIHKKIATFYLPLLLGEDALNIRLRINDGGYGMITDFRTNGKTYEFRAPSAEWLTTPHIAASTLAYIATVYNEIINRPENIKKYSDIIIKNNQQAKALQELTTSNFIILTDIILKRIKKAIKTFEYYPLYKDEIDFILNPKLVFKEKQKANFEILKGWKLRTKNKITKSLLINKKILAKKINDINIDLISTAIDIKWNDDEGVGNFVSDLKHRIIAYGWNLKHGYIFYGLRNGVDGYVAENANHKWYTGQEMIKSLADYETITNIDDRIMGRYCIMNAVSSEEKRNNIIVIGIPYKDRIAKNSKKMIELIYNIEKGDLKPTTIDLGALPNVINQTSGIAAVCNKRQDSLRESDNDRERRLKNEELISSHHEELVEPVPLVRG